MYEISLKQYLDNPMGKGSAIMNNSSDIKNNYQDLFIDISDKIKIKWYNYKNTFLIAYLQIPSTSKNTKEYFYDAIIQFDYKQVKELKNLLDINIIKVFSNCPSFVFTYAKALYNQDLFCEWLKDKYPASFFKMESHIRNPFNVIGFEKSFYISALYIKYLYNHRYNPLPDSDITNNILNKTIKIFNFNDLKKSIHTTNEILNLHNENKIINNKNNEKILDDYKSKDKNYSTKSISSIKSINKVKKVSSIKKIKHI